MITIKEVTSKISWTNFLEQTYTGFFPFFQTWNWGEVQKKIGFPIMRLGLYEKDKLVGVVQLVEVHAKRGSYFHLRHGPVLLHFTKSSMHTLMVFLKELAKKKHIDFIRMSPLIEDNQDLNFLQSLGWHNAPIHNMDAQICWVLDISQSEDEILSGMRKSHRYSIKKSLLEKIEIKKADKVSADTSAFFALYKDLALKRGFVAHKGLTEEIEILGKENEAVLFLAKYEGKIIGGALIDFVGPMAIYHHGATDDAYRHLLVSYLLQWEAIKEAKKRGKKIYNFWGIAATESKKHPWYGLSLFKTGFGGERKEFLRAKDLPLTVGYYKAYIIDLLTKIRKGY